MTLPFMARPPRPAAAGVVRTVLARRDLAAHAAQPAGEPGLSFLLESILVY